MTTAAVVTLAYLQVAADRDQDIIDHFVQVVATALRRAASPALEDVQAELQKEFGLSIPQGAIRTILKRAERRGLVMRVNDRLQPNVLELERLGFDASRRTLTEAYEALAADLARFADQSFSLQWAQDEAEAALNIFVSDYSLTILQIGDSAERDDQQRPVAVPGAGVVAAAFARHLEHTAPEQFDKVEALVRGAMIAGALYYPELGSVTRHLEGLALYLDTAIVLRACGYAGLERLAAARELLDLAYGLGADLRIFSHTEQEIHQVLDSAVEAVRRPRSSRTYGEVAESFLHAQVTPGEAEFEVAQLPQRLEALRVHVAERPRHEVPYGVDEKALEKTLRGVVHYARDEALYHDLDALTAVHRIRGGRTQRLLESSRAIFVTSNTALARAARQFFGREYDQPYVPVCMPEHQMATLLWVKKPLQSPDLPRKRLIADCYAGVRPSDATWRDFLARVDTLTQKGTITPDDAALLRVSSTSRRVLMEVTAGVRPIEDETVGQVLNRVTAEAVAKAVTKAAAQPPPGAEDRQPRSEEVQRAERLETELGRRDTRQWDYIRREAVRRGQRARRALWAVIAIVVAGATLAALPEPVTFAPRLGGPWKIAFAAVAIAGVLFSQMTSVLGFSLRSLGRDLELKAAARTTSRLCRELGVSPRSGPH